MFGFRTLRARLRYARASAEVARCRDEWGAAEERQDTRRMGEAGARLRAARTDQLRAELDLMSLRRRKGRVTA